MTEKNTWSGKTARASIAGGVANIVLDHQQASVNKFDALTLRELREIIDVLKAMSENLRGVVVQSAKKTFVVGADITEFLGWFKDPKFESRLNETQKLFNDLEDLGVPSLAAINGICLGGGFELALACTYRIAAPEASIGLPESKLGLVPGWGGCVRLPRVIGLDNAIEWIASGKAYSAEQALKVGAIDAIATQEELLSSAERSILNAIEGNLDWKSRRQEKLRPLSLISPVEKTMAIESAKAVILPKAGKHFPAPIKALQLLDQTSSLERDAALGLERQCFTKLAATPSAHNLISIFLNDQANKKALKNYASKGSPVKRAAVLGAGIMGGGIAYQSASKGVPILLKDIEQGALDRGMQEVNSLLGKQFERKKIDASSLAKTLSAITPTLSYGDIASADLVIEAVVENEGIKAKVIKELASHTKPGAVVASNTSTILIDSLATSHPHPENFCGMHFFNPVHRMPLVEIICGSKSSSATIGRVVNYAWQLGKVPVVVKDCPGFLVNRILFPYFRGFLLLVNEGVNPYAIDRVMEDFGWPMGPAYLLDVIGLDTALHAQSIIAKGYPKRMPVTSPSLLANLVEAGYLGQKNGQGFYQYTRDKRGSLKKQAWQDRGTTPLGKSASPKTPPPEDIIDRLMFPMLTEALLCLSEGIVSSASELDIALINGIGFPPHLGGAIKHIDDYGHDRFSKRCEQFTHLGEIYRVPKILEDHIRTNRQLYSNQ